MNITVVEFYVVLTSVKNLHEFDVRLSYHNKRLLTYLLFTYLLMIILACTRLLVLCVYLGYEHVFTLTAIRGTGQTACSLEHDLYIKQQYLNCQSITLTCSGLQ